MIVKFISRQNISVTCKQVGNKSSKVSQYTGKLGVQVRYPERATNKLSYTRESSLATRNVTIQ